MLLCVTQERITIKFRKRLGEGAVFFYEDAAKGHSFFSFCNEANALVQRFQTDGTGGPGYGMALRIQKIGGGDGIGLIILKAALIEIEVNGEFIALFFNKCLRRGAAARLCARRRRAAGRYPRWS